MRIRPVKPDSQLRSQFAAFPGKSLAPFILLPLLLVACGEQRLEELPPTRGIILISIDTLRADRLGCYGYTQPTSPFLDSLADRAVLFEKCVVQLPGTLPSHMSMLTGLYPKEHNVYPPDGVLADAVPYVPELLSDLGYRTAGHTEGGYVHGRYGFPRGFREWNHDAKKVETDIERTFARGLEFLSNLGQEDRFFLFLHTYSVHDPYFPAQEYERIFWDGPAPPNAFPATGPNLVEVNRGQRSIDEETLRYFSSLYDASIRYTDGVIAGFFSRLDEVGLLDDSTVIITSDHGEEFLEHGQLTHEQIYVETLLVPLMVVHPEVRSSRRVGSVVETIDIAATILELAGAPVPPMSGRSLLGMVRGATPPESSQAYSEAFMTPSTSLIRQGQHGIHQLVRHQLTRNETTKNETDWIQSTAVFDLTGPERVVAATAFHRDRILTLQVDGHDDESVIIQPHRWTRLPVAPGEHGGLTRTRVTVDGCEVPRELGLNEDARCLGFRLQGDDLVHFNLYDLVADEDGVRDIASESPPPLAELARDLGLLTMLPRAEAVTEQLDPELEERLRALGYLQ